MFLCLDGRQDLLPLSVGLGKGVGFIVKVGSQFFVGENGFAQKTVQL